MRNTKNPISLIIPAYNEAEAIAECLQAALGQQEPFYEIIVVDNASNDETAKIVRSFRGVKLLREAQKGVVYARNCGFNAARGEIIARIDADTRLTPDWSRQIRQSFEDRNLSALSGRPQYYDVALPRVASGIDAALRKLMAHELKDWVFLQGANMALRRSSWEQVKQALCTRSNMHEDFDLAIHLQERGYKVIYDESLVARLSARRVDSGFWSFAHYAHMSPHTYALHAVGRGRWMYVVVAITVVLWLPARILYRGYDAESDTFSLLRVFKPSRKLAARVDLTGV